MLCNTRIKMITISRFPTSTGKTKAQNSQINKEGHGNFPNTLLLARKIVKSYSKTRIKCVKVKKDQFVDFLAQLSKNWRVSDKLRIISLISVKIWTLTCTRLPEQRRWVADRAAKSTQHCTAQRRWNLVKLISPNNSSMARARRLAGLTIRTTRSKLSNTRPRSILKPASPSQR